MASANQLICVYASSRVRRRLGAGRLCCEETGGGSFLSQMYDVGGIRRNSLPKQAEAGDANDDEENTAQP